MAAGRTICFPLKVENVVTTVLGECYRCYSPCELFRYLHLQFFVFLKSCFLIFVCFVSMSHFHLLLSHLGVLRLSIKDLSRFEISQPFTKIFTSLPIHFPFQFHYHVVVYHSLVFYFFDVSIFGLRSSVSLLKIS